MDRRGFPPRVTRLLRLIHLGSPLSTTVRGRGGPMKPASSLSKAFAAGVGPEAVDFFNGLEFQPFFTILNFSALFLLFFPDFFYFSIDFQLS